MTLCENRISRGYANLVLKNTLTHELIHAFDDKYGALAFDGLVNIANKDFKSIIYTFTALFFRFRNWYAWWYFFKTRKQKGCNGQDTNWKDPQYLACSEVRAANLSGDCHWRMVNAFDTNCISFANMFCTYTPLPICFKNYRCSTLLYHFPCTGIGTTKCKSKFLLHREMSFANIPWGT